MITPTPYRRTQWDDALAKLPAVAVQKCPYCERALGEFGMESLDGHHISCRVLQRLGLMHWRARS